MFRLPFTGKSPGGAQGDTTHFGRYVRRGRYHLCGDP